MRLTWSDLDLRERQSAHATCRVVRNGRLATDAHVATGPELLRLSRTVRFPDRVVPSVDVPPVTMPLGGSLARTLGELLAPFAGIGTDVVPERRLRVAVAYAWAVAEGVRTRVPVTLVDTGIGAGDVLPTVGAVARSLAQACASWWESTAATSGTGAVLEVAVGLTGVDGRPLARADTWRSCCRRAGPGG